MAERDPDTESDPKSDVHVTSYESFFEEVKHVLQNALGDPVAFGSAEYELESVRQAYNQIAVNLNKAIIQAIIELPATKFQKSVHCEVYAKCLEEVLDKFTKLLEPRRGRRGAFLLDASVVAKSKLGKILKIKYGEDEPSTSTAVSKSLTSEMQSSTSTSSKSSPDPGTGEFSAVFDHRGGRLGTYWSDDYLEIPKDAIPKGERWRVSGFIDTSLERYQQYADYDKGERLVAPVVRYRVEGDKRFNKLVKAVIHHSIRCGCTSMDDKVSVLLQSESTDNTEKCVEELPNKKRQKQEGTACFEVDPLHITVYTTHFSNIICKICDREHPEGVVVKAMLYGRLNQDGADGYRATLELYVVVQSALNNRAVYSESFHNEQRDAGNVYLGCAYFPQSLRQIGRNDRIVLSTQHLTQGWDVLPSTSMNYKASDFIPCLRQPTDPRCVDTLALGGQTSKLNGMLIVSLRDSSWRSFLVSFISARDESLAKISFSHTTAGDTPSISIAGLGVSSEQWKLTDKKLNYVAHEIKDWHWVGLNLNISATELDVIKANMCDEHPRIKIFEILRLWRNRNNSRYTRSELKAILRDALQRVRPAQMAAIGELDRDINQVEIDAEVRGNAIVRQVTDGDGVVPIGLGVDIRPGLPN